MRICDFITRIMVYRIRCQQCGIDEEINTIDGEWKWNDTPTKYFKRHGWDVEYDKALCPDCKQRLGDKE